jgi:hypothetical protein
MINRAPKSPHVSLSPESGRRSRSVVGALDRVVVSVVIGAGSDLGEAVQAFVAEYNRRRFLPAVAQAISAGARELVSNAASYGSVSGEVLVEIVESPVWVAVRVTNESIPARIDMLQQQMKRLADAGPDTARAQRANPAAHGARMPGLAKVMHEQGLELDIEVNDRKVTVTARRAR